MTDPYARIARAGLSPLVEELPEPPAWEDLDIPQIRIDTSRPSRGGGPWLTAAIAIVAVAILGATSLLLRANPTTGGDVPLDIAAAIDAGEVWWRAVISGDIDAATEIAHPEAHFSYDVISRELLPSLGEVIAVTVSSDPFGGPSQWALCFAVEGTGATHSGSMVYREYQGRWLPWEQRPGTERCGDAEPTSTTTIPAPGTVPTITIPGSWTGEGLVFVRDPREAPEVAATPAEIITLGGSRITITLPVGFGVGPTTTQVGFRSSDGRGAFWYAVPRGSGLWGFADLRLELLDLVEVKGGVLAYYHTGLDPEEGTQFITLWQGELFDLISYSFESFADAMAFVEITEIEESPGGAVMAVSTWAVIDEEVVVTVFTPDDSGRGDAILEIRPVDSERAHFVGPGDQGRWGEFQLVDSTIAEGFVFRSDTAWATLVPGGVPRVDSLTGLEAEILNEFNITWERAG